MPLIVFAWLLAAQFGAPILQAPPIAGLRAGDLHDTFHQSRGGGRHEALDIMEPRGTPVHAVVEGTIVKLFLSKPGGKTIYQFDNSQIFSYYYAHLDRYADGLHEGMHVAPGEVIGYVGSSGNAHTPHLHFAIFQLGPEKRWWQGTAINPYGPLLELVRK
jgi:murein DD-endopeptidase MepM/ murein hydrolase activator NlpD